MRKQTQALCARVCQATIQTALFVALSVASFVALGQTVSFGAAGDELLASGLQKHESGSYDAAISDLETYISTYPNSESRNKAELYAGHSYMARNPESATDAARAQEHFKYIVNQGAKAEYYREACFHTAHSYYNLQNYAQAKQLFQQFLTEFPKDGYVQYVYYYLGDCAAQLGSPQEAIQYFDRALTEYPNSPLKWNCTLEKAASVCRMGDYTQANSLFSQIISGKDASIDLVAKATLGTSVVQMAQQQYDAAISILEAYVAQHSSDPQYTSALEDVYLYEAYAYFAKGDFERALLLVDQIGRMNATMDPSVAVLKIHLLVGLNRVDEAESLLNQLASSSYAQTNPDGINYRRGLISLARGDWNAAIVKIETLLQIQRNGSIVNIYYYNNAARNGMDDVDFLGACGVLIMSYASRYGAQRNQDDYVAQEAIYQAVSTYVASKNTPALHTILAAIDKKRQSAQQNPIKQGADALLVSPPSQNSSFSGFNAASGGFSNPTEPTQFQNPGFRPMGTNENQPAYNLNMNPPPNQNGQTVPQVSNVVQPLQQGSGNVQPIRQGAGVGSNLNGSYTYQQGQNVQPFSGAQGGAYAYQQGQNVNSFGIVPNNGTYSQNLQPGTPTTLVNQTNGTGTYSSNSASANYPSNGQANASVPNGQFNGNGANVQTTVNVNTPLTPAKAQEAIKRATEFYVNQDYERANETLLEARLTSETFWQDCPAEAARIALLRARTLLELNKRAEVVMTCQDLIDSAPYSQEAAVAGVYLGLMADEAGRQDDAIRFLSQATSGRNDFPLLDVALYTLGMNEWERRNIDDAAQTFGKIYRYYPTSPYWSHAVWALAQIESDSHNDAEAEKLVNEALLKKPDVSIVDYLLFLKGEIALRAKDYPKALVAFDMIVELYPNSVWYTRAKNRLSVVPEEYLDPEYLALAANTTRSRASQQGGSASDAQGRQTASNENLSLDSNRNAAQNAAKTTTSNSDSKSSVPQTVPRQNDDFQFSEPYAVPRPSAPNAAKSQTSSDSTLKTPGRSSGAVK